MRQGTEARPADGIGWRLYRGAAFALIAGLAGSGLSGIPALFLQSVFVSEAQRCTEAIERAEAGEGDAALTCSDEFTDPPVWLPVTMLVGGGVMGAVGGFAYGILSPGRRARNVAAPPAPPWLPF